MSGGGGRESQATARAIPVFDSSRDDGLDGYRLVNSKLAVLRDSEKLARHGRNHPIISSVRLAERRAKTGKSNPRRADTGSSRRRPSSLAGFSQRCWRRLKARTGRPGNTAKKGKARVGTSR
jgi:hypothetical protein